jgi:hypothetical protein
LIGDHVQAPTRAADRLYRTRRELLGLTELPVTLFGFDDRAAWGLAWLVSNLWWRRKSPDG